MHTQTIDQSIDTLMCVSAIISMDAVCFVPLINVLLLNTGVEEALVSSSQALTSLVPYRLFTLK